MRLICCAQGGRQVTVLVESFPCREASAWSPGLANVSKANWPRLASAMGLHRTAHTLSRVVRVLITPPSPGSSLISPALSPPNPRFCHHALLPDRHGDRRVCTFLSHRMVLGRRRGTAGLRVASGRVRPPPRRVAELLRTPPRRVAEL